MYPHAHHGVSLNSMTPACLLSDLPEMEKDPVLTALPKAYQVPEFCCIKTF